MFHADFFRINFQARTDAHDQQTPHDQPHNIGLPDIAVQQSVSRDRASSWLPPAGLNQRRYAAAFSTFRRVIVQTVNPEYPGEFAMFISPQGFRFFIRLGVIAACTLFLVRPMHTGCTVRSAS